MNGGLKMTKTKTFELSISRSGIPCLWEHGGGWSNTGESVIIAEPDASPAKPIYIKKSGSLACSRHALIPVHIGSVVIEAHHHRKDFFVSVWHIKSINETDETAEAEMIAEYSSGEWVFINEPRPEVADHLPAAVEAAQNKATCYHCREPHYID
jgi:hypothetical protein